MSHAPARPPLPREQVMVPPGHAWNRLPLIGAVAAGIGLSVLAVTGRAHVEDALRSWLTALVFFLGPALGCLFFVLTQFAAKAGWSVVVRRVAENVMGTLPLFALLFVPVLLGVPHLYHWADPQAVAHDELLRWKQPYLSHGFFAARALAYFAVWSALALYFLRASRGQDRTGDEGVTRRLQRVAGPGLVLFAITVTFAGVDWLMSLDPHWYSTIFGVYVFSGAVMAAFALLSVLTAAMRRAGLLRVVGVGHFHDLGKLLFAFTCFWSYIAFCQYFLIWYANIPEEVGWYAVRLTGSWRTASQVLAVGHFAVPFLFLLPRDVKRRPRFLVMGASWMLLMHYLDIYWLVMPGHRPGFSPGLSDLAALLGVGGLFLAAFGWILRRGAVVPLRDPRLAESLAFDGT